jgi:phosphate/sulfate permease
MIGKKVLHGGSYTDIILSTIVVIIAGGIAYLFYRFFSSIINYIKKAGKPIAAYTKVITVKQKRVETTVHKYNEHVKRGEMIYVYPKSYNTYKYYIDGTDRNVYSISEFNFNRVKENDSIEVAIEEYKNDEILYITKIIKF